jgi:hypothetical protein
MPEWLTNPDSPAQAKPPLPPYPGRNLLHECRISCHATFNRNINFEPQPIPGTRSSPAGFTPAVSIPLIDGPMIKEAGKLRVTADSTAK